MPMMYGWNGDWGGMLIVMLINAAVWIALIGLVIWGLGRLLARRESSSGQLDSGPSALEILRQRYARGEIDAATFDDMRRRIEGDQTSPKA
jgi:putative membrane protein